MPFTFTPTALKEVIVIEPQFFGDHRGFFGETYKKSEFKKAGINEEFVQDNHSFSSKGVLRGLHYQLSPYQQGKLIRVISGSVWDVAVDIRPNSPTFKQWVAITLSSENKKMFYIPPGFAHGFLSLSDDTHFLYKCTAEYAPSHERAIIYNDCELSIEWPIAQIGAPQISDKDKNAPPIQEAQLQ